MKTKFRSLTKLALIMWASFTLSAVAGGSMDYERQAERILAEAEIKGGLIVHVGCGAGELTAALGGGEGYLVQGLDTAAENVEKARQYIRAKQLYGQISVDMFDGRGLPYADNMVNLIVAEKLGGVTAAEAMRVLAPGGVLYAKQDGRWTKSVKPQPRNTDEWTHYLHDAGGNPVAHDDVVGPPGYTQWIAGPKHTRGHEHTPSINALVSSGGRIFYIADEGPIGSVRQPSIWRLVARDAYNGILLWERPVENWYPHIVNWGMAPRQLQRRLVAVGDRVYVTLGLHAELSAVDATTGEILKVYEQTRGAEEVICHKGVLLLAVRSLSDERTAELEKMEDLEMKDRSPLHARETAEPFIKHFRSIEGKAAKSILALDADTEKVLWKKTGAEASGLRTLSLCAEKDRVFYQNGKEVICLDLKTGEKLWSRASAALCLVHDGTIVCVGGGKVSVLSVETGKSLWTEAASLTQIRDVFIANGSLWVGGFKPIEGKRGPSWGPYFVTQRDLAAGKILMRIEPENPGHHHRCYTNKATDRYILGGRRGVEFFDLESGEVRWHSWVRGVCRYGIMPANGLLYAPPHSCGCYIAAKLTGFNALAPMRREGQEPDSQAEQILRRGPDYTELPAAKPETGSSDDWPAYRHDAQRSGRTASVVPSKLRRKWRADVGGRLSSLTVAGGKVFTASVDEHRVSALDADSGKSMWDFTAGGRVDSPPTIHQDRAIFGSRDGCVYSLRASDGELAWRLQTARGQRRIAAYGQLESVSSVFGSVLIDDGAAYFTAGRSSYVDGGIDLYRIEARTGKTLSINRIYSPDLETGKQPDQQGPAYMPGALADILSCDDEYVYLRDAVFGKDGGDRTKTSPHLFALTGFLDDSWAHRSYWAFGTRCSISTGCSGRDRNLISGRLLVFDEATIYGYGRARLHWSNQLQDGPYRLFAVKPGETKPQWEKRVPLQVRAIVLADDVLFAAGPPIKAGQWPKEAGEAILMAVSASDGTELAQYKLDSSPVFDGMAAANGRLYLSLENGRVLCMEGQ